MTKKRRAAAPVENRRALSRREREARYRRWLYVGGAVVLALIVGVTGVGFYQWRVAEPASPVATVNGVPIRTDTYQRWVQYRRYNVKSSLQQLENSMSQLDQNDPNTQSLYAYFVQQQQQLQQELGQMSTLQPLDELIDDELVRQEAARRGITVTPDEVQREIEIQLGYNLPTPAPEPTVVGPTITPTEQITATPAPTSTPYPTPTPMSEQAFKDLYAQVVQGMRKNAGYSEADFRDLVAIGLLRNKLQAAMAAEVPTSTEQIHARHILLDDQAAAQAALDRINKGEDFATVAKEVSTDTATKDQGGDLGWFPRGQMTEEFENAAFALQPGQVSGLVETTYGYHIIKVEEREANRPVDASILSQMQDGALSQWLSKQRLSDAVKRYWSSDKVPKNRDLATASQ